MTDIETISSVDIETISSISSVGISTIESINGIISNPQSGSSFWSWGLNQRGQLAQGNITRYSSPVQVGSLTNWEHISAGNDFTMASKSNGTLWAVGGYNTDGQLGLGVIYSISSPVQVGSLTNWSNISCGEGYSIAIKSNGTIWVWGDNGYGQLGLGDIVKKSSPVQVGSLTDWTLVQAGYHSSIAVKSNGTLWLWGDNGYGQLAQGNITSYSSPVQVGSLTDWGDSVLSRYGDHFLVIKSNGTLWTWGRNSFGQLGLGDTTHRSSPVQVGSLTNWSSIGSGFIQSSLIKTDGTLWSWGYNNSGQLGVGNTTTYSSPVQVGLLTDWSKIASCGSHVLAIKTDGTLWAVGGYNLHGQLGLGDTTNRSSPNQVGSLTDWTEVYCGYEHSLSLK